MMPRGWRDAVSRVRVQLLVASLVAGFGVLAALGVLPPREVLLSEARFLIDRYGALFVIPISFVENLAGINAYFPGSVAILLAMSATAGDPQRAMEVFLAIVVPSFAAHQMNYVIGKYVGRGSPQPGSQGGRYRTIMEANVIFIVSLWHPHFAALSCIDAGAQGMRYPRFLAVFSFWFLVWNSFWGLLMYKLGSAVIGEAQNTFAIGVVLAVWAAWDLFRFRELVEAAVHRGLSRRRSSGAEGP